MLFPQQNSYRAIYSLNGLWRLLHDPEDVGEREDWPRRPLPSDAFWVAVPGAWNEQLTECGLKNYVGKVWYERALSIPAFDRKTHCVILRVGAADHSATVWLNGTRIGSHQGGFLPFECDLTDAVEPGGAPNRLVISVDSRLSMESLPQGIDPVTPPYDKSRYDRRHVFPPTRFDFFPYGGLTRSIQLMVVPRSRVSSISVDASLSGNVWVSVGCEGEPQKGTVEILDVELRSVVGPIPIDVKGAEGACTLSISAPHRWSPATPYLYTALVRLFDSSGAEIDRYEETFGVRTIAVEGGKLLLNGEPLYLVGFGKHEDYPIVGRGEFRPAHVRDFELMRWTGANSFRTSHYPYNEELMQMADRLGFLVIDEVPATSLGFLSDRFEDLVGLLENHKRVMKELIARDRNHPSVISWSTANEPNLWNEPSYGNEASRRYFREIYQHVHSIDPSRPVIAITTPAFSVEDDSLAACDIIGINRYFGWYTEPASLEKARRKLDQEMDALFARYGKPIMITECGADTMEGSHATTLQMFTEEYQTELLRVYASVADRKAYCAGFHVWNFADFLTPQHFRRVILNRKGVFTREREPKNAAFFLRAHWTALDRVMPRHRPKSYSNTFLVQDIESQE
jgi:beta-glucuronidase